MSLDTKRKTAKLNTYGRTATGASGNSSTSIDNPQGRVAYDLIRKLRAELIAEEKD
jgi:hypothetical protein